MRLFTIMNLDFEKENFQDNIEEFEDIIPIIQDLQENLQYEEISCVGKNDCCNLTDKNYIVEILGFINENDEFITKEEAEKGQFKQLDLFVINTYMCIECGKWIINILE